MAEHITRILDLPDNISIQIPPRNGNYWYNKHNGALDYPLP